MNCESCPCHVSDEFYEPIISEDGDELGKKLVTRHWCDSPNCIQNEKRNN